MALVLTRLVVGWIFIESGWGKLHNLEGVIGYFGELGIPFAKYQAPFVALVELIGGLCLWLGVFNRIAGLLLSSTMVVAILTAKRSDIHSVSDLFGTSEFLYIALLMWVIILGSGKFSIQNLWKKE